MYFGQLTAELHDALVEDPKPYRKDVKTLLANLLAWAQGLRMEEVVIDKPFAAGEVGVVFSIIKLFCKIQYVILYVVVPTVNFKG